MARAFVSVAPEDTLGEAAEKLAAADAGSALVLDFGRLCGISPRATSCAPSPSGSTRAKRAFARG
jgi:hypothetical protein